MKAHSGSRRKSTRRRRDLLRCLSSTKLVLRVISGGSSRLPDFSGCFCHCLATAFVGWEAGVPLYRWHRSADTLCVRSRPFSPPWLLLRNVKVGPGLALYRLRVGDIGSRGN